MRLVLTGASGTGKTTLAKALAVRFDIPLIEEDFRDVVFAMNGVAKSAENTDERKQAIDHYLTTCWRWLDARTQAEQSHAGFVSDRCCFDILVRFVTSSIGNERPNDLIKLLQFCRDWARRVDMVVVPPIAAWSLQSTQNESGLPRRASPGNKLRSHSTTLGLLWQFCRAPVLYIPPRYSTTEERVTAVFRSVEALPPDRRAPR
jgi:predicted ATPase